MRGDSSSSISSLQERPAIVLFQDFQTYSVAYKAVQVAAGINLKDALEIILQLRMTPMFATD